MNPDDLELHAAFAAFERFEASGTDRDLDVGVASLSAVLRREPDHPEAIDWRRALALGLTWQAQRDSNSATWDRALHQLNLARAMAATQHPDQSAELDGDLALMRFQRFHFLAETWTEETCRLRHRELIAQVSELQPTPVRSMVLGLTALHQFHAEADPTDREAGIALLAVSLPLLHVDTELVAVAFGEYAKALDGARMEDHVDPAEASKMRDEAIEAVLQARQVIADEERPDLVLLDAELHCSRGDWTDNATDLTTGLDRLVLFDTLADPNDPDRGIGLLQQAMAHLRLWHITNDPAARAAVVGCCDAALAAGLPDDLVLDAQRRALDVVVDQLVKDPSEVTVLETSARVNVCATALDDRPDADRGDRAGLAMAIAVVGLSLSGVGPGLFDPDRLPTLRAVAATHPDPPAEWDTRLTLLDAVIQFYAGLRDGSAGGLEELLEAWRQSGVASLFGDQLATIAAAMACFDATLTGDLGRLQAAKDLLRQRSDAAPDANFLTEFVESLDAYKRGSTETHSIAAFVRLAALTESGTQDLWSTKYLLPFVRALAALISLSEPQVVDAPLPTMDPLGKVICELTVATNIFASLMGPAGHDAGELRRRLRKAEVRLDEFAAASPARLGLLSALSAGSIRLATTMPTDPAATGAAVHWGTALKDQLGGPEHPLWTEQLMQLARAHRLRRAPQDLPTSRRIGLEALRGNAWQVLVQSGTEHAVVAARTAAGVAMEVTDWCAADHAADDVVRAVEAGRGLALHAASTARGVARILTKLGDHDLAKKWVEVDGVDRLPLPPDAGFQADIRGDLRRRVLRAVRGDVADVLDPPGLDHIRFALQTQGSDALVYLMAGDAQGRAVVVPARGPVEVLDLAGLISTAAPLGRYTSAYARSHSSEVRTVGRYHKSLSWPDELDRVLRWAWEAVGDPLLTAAGRWSASTTPRLVLVPGGELALVPWHAAARLVDGQLRYLVQDMVISYAASARLLCDIIGRRPLGTGTAVLIGNPTGDLPAAGREAKAVRAAFYPEATYLGARDDGPADGHGRGTPTEVLDRLTDRSRPCSMLHLACHAHAEPTHPTNSHLLLADRMPLKVGELLEQTQSASLPLDTVLLAACSTNVSGADYDEAFSIATAFLAAGARSVVGSLWPVPDGPTAHLMFMVHHYRHSEGLRLREAVRQAQLWMLDPDHVRPTALPEAMANSFARERAHSDPVNWAGFAHGGL